MTRKVIFSLFIILILIPQTLSATEFDELDKPPEGAHKGQMFLSAFFTLGWPTGDVIDSETEFLDGSIYSFSDEVSKELDVSHQSFSLGISYEYMPIDHIGAMLRLRRTYLVQHTIFGSEYENWKGYLYRDFSIYLAPVLHATTRKTWDFVLIPMLGYSFAKFNATPVAKKTLQDYSTGEEYGGDTGREFNSLSYGVNLNCTIYFTGGLFISFGGEWMRNQIDLGKSFDLTNPQTDKTYSISTSSNIDTYSVIISAGYAFSN